MPRTYNEVDARVTRLMKELENLKKELAGKQGLLEEGDGVVLTPDTQTNKTTVSVNENVVALKEDFEANPTLAGTEPTLEGLKLLGTNYKVGGGGDVYLHSIEVVVNSWRAQMYITSLKETAYTKDEIYELNRMKNIFNNIVYYNSTNQVYKRVSYSFQKSSNHNQIEYQVYNITTGTQESSYLNDDITSFSDTVTKL